MAAWLTTEDESNYGRDLVDFSQRAALHVVAPHLQALDQQNAELRERLRIESRHRLDQAVAAAISNYKEIDNDPNWHRYLLTTDALSGRVRQTLLNDAIASGDANRVIAFFRGFQRETGGAQVASAAPGRTRQTSGRRTYTRDEIGRLYALHRKGHWQGREAEWAQQDADIIAAAQERRLH